MPPRNPVLRALPVLPDACLRLLSLHDRDPGFYPAFLDSAATAGELGRYSLLLAAPGERLELDRGGRLTGPGAGEAFCARLNAWWRQECGAAPPHPWPFAGGWFLYLGYELATEVEPTLKLPASPLPLVASAIRVAAAIVHDHATGKTVALGEEGAAEAVAKLAQDFIVAAPAAEGDRRPAAVSVEEDDPGIYLDACRQALDHIAAGDVYQANLARGWRVQTPGGPDAAGLYLRLRAANPGAFAGTAQLPGFRLLSSSPERLVRVRGRRIDTRPIAGTRPRRRGGDERAIAELTGSAKEQAEHVMLIDLERNDLGRLCEAGTVQVDEFMVVESYAHVHHIVSNVSGGLRPDVEPGDVIRALFPGGTITGCPKVRCMQLIGELEGKGRGAYTGAMGYLALDGSLDLNILIRTMTIEGGAIELRAGAGIVADSIPEHELDETRAKARGLLRALGSEA
ncbi:MAG: aminodeoxychorismate synthase component I [Gammaproteobacteria bacterium]|nr:aminodeoxychorismate synthase component I [Gammaproteobacteria bacterium]